ncbi:hypothetical protein C8J56DRAFT_891637 [Mycena floridula]|nr:hypothetical protein C8J56DRAFT_891637 [Mycena floridula]
MSLRTRQGEARLKQRFTDNPVFEARWREQKSTREKKCYREMKEARLAALMPPRVINDGVFRILSDIKVDPAIADQVELGQTFVSNWLSTYEIPDTFFNGYEEESQDAAERKPSVAMQQAFQAFSSGEEQPYIALLERHHGFLTALEAFTPLSQHMDHLCNITAGHPELLNNIVEERGNLRQTEQMVRAIVKGQEFCIHSRVYAPSTEASTKLLVNRLASTARNWPQQGFSDIKVEDLKTLAPGCWVTTVIIDFFGQFYQADARLGDTVVRCQFAAKHLGDSKLHKQEAALKYFKQPQRMFKRLLIPVNKDNNHWLLCYINVEDQDYPSISVYDSWERTYKQGAKKKQEELPHWRLVQTIKELVIDIYQHFQLEVPDDNQWKLCPRVEVPFQANTFDCGVYVMEYMRHILWYGGINGGYIASSDQVADWGCIIPPKIPNLEGIRFTLLEDIRLQSKIDS